MVEHWKTRTEIGRQEIPWQDEKRGSELKIK